MLKLMNVNRAPKRELLDRVEAYVRMIEEKQP